MTAPLPLTDRIRFGAGIAAANRGAAIEAINSLAAWGYDLIWMPDHVAFTGPSAIRWRSSPTSRRSNESHLRHGSLPASATPSGHGR